ncbi:MAG: hypothetical protein HY900_31515 [Deltaproteobacteria bacterium]|nr:hypothetical protein [Deltaproteobacteria bacterium]
MNYKEIIHAVALLASFIAPGDSWGRALPADDLFAVTFVGEREGWACGRWGTILHTRDGGATWERQRTGVEATLSSVHFVDGRNGWAVGDQGTILHTADGGKRWERQLSPVSFFLMAVRFVTKDKGWIVTERTHILHTEDGGKTWAIQFHDQDFILKSLSFSDKQNGWAVGEYGFVYHTADGGKRWVRQAGEFGLSDATGELVGGSFLFDVAAVDARTAWVVGIDGYVARTVDGGKTWQKATKGLPKTHLFGLSAGEKGVVIVGDAALLLTRDGGETWRSAAVEPTIRYGWLYRVARRGTRGFVAVGQAGRIYQADPGADRWTLTAAR